MIGSNLNKKIFPFFDSVKDPVRKTGVSDSLILNHLYSAVSVEVSGITSGDIAVEGCINSLNSDGTVKTDEECSWSKLSLIDLNGMKTIDNITANGIYAVGVDGMSRVRVVINSVSGAATIVGVAGV